MKKILLQKLKHNLRTQPHLMRKLKIIAAVAVVGFFLIGGLTIWAGISAFNYVASTLAQQTTEVPRTQSLVQEIEKEVVALPTLRLESCWKQTLNLLSVQVWLEKPMQENFNHLKVACLEKKPEACEGADCPKPQNTEPGAEGTWI